MKADRLVRIKIHERKDFQYEHERFESVHRAIPLEDFPRVCILVVQPKQSTLLILKDDLLQLKESHLNVQFNE